MKHSLPILSYFCGYFVSYYDSGTFLRMAEALKYQLLTVTSEFWVNFDDFVIFMRKSLNDDDIKDFVTMATVVIKYTTELKLNYTRFLL